MTTMLCFDSVDKSYGDLEVLRSVNLEIGSGLQCLVGRNGAGKTTLMRLGPGLTEPNGGTVRMFGFDPRVHPEAMARAGILLEADQLFHFLRPLEFLDYCSALYGLGLDPVAVARLCRMLRDFAANGRGVLLSSHRLELVEEIADRVYFVADGAVTPWSPERVKTWYDELRVAGAGEGPPGELTG